MAEYRFISLKIFAAIGCICLHMAVVQGQKTGPSSTPFPDDVYRIFQASCWTCHGPEGGRLPHSRLNLERWNSYDPEKQAQKTSLICSTLKKGAMPPKSFRKSHPELIPTQEQVAIMCKWAESMKTEKNKKK